MKDCIQKLLAKDLARYGPRSDQSSTTKSVSQKEREDLIIGVADSNSSSLLKSALRAIAHSDARLSRHTAAHKMTLEQLRRHAAKCCSNDEKAVWMAIFGRRLQDALPRALGNLELYTE